MNASATHVLLLFALAFTSACGGGGASNLQPVDNELFTDFEAMAGDYVDPTGSPLSGVTVRTVDLPFTGDPEFSGFVGGDLFAAGSGVDEGSLVGRLSLTADFGTSSITGSAIDFQDETGLAYTGSLLVTIGSIASDGLVDSTLSGNLFRNGTDLSSGILLEGNFLNGGAGEAPEAVGGTAVGSIGSSGFDGAFIATR